MLVIHHKHFLFLTTHNSQLTTHITTTPDLTPYPDTPLL